MKSIKQIELRSRRVMLSGEEAETYASAIASPDDAALIFSRLLNGIDSERFLVLLLNVKNRILGYVEVARGAADSCPVDTREVFRAAIVQNASAIISCHNHPSGDPTPSTVDRRLTEKLVSAGELLGVPMLDHVIVTDDGGFYSFSEQGKI